MSSLARGCLFAGLVGLLMACNPYGAYCEEYMDCVGGNEKDVDACVEEAEGVEDLADYYGCGEYWEESFECAEAKSSCECPPDPLPCDNKIYTSGNSCEDEERRLSRCM